MPEILEHRSKQTPTADQTAVLAADDARLAAMCRNDFAALAQMLDERLTYCHSTGAVEDKSQYLDTIRSGKVKYVSMHRDIERLNLWGACAVMQGTVAVAAEVGGQPYRTRAAFTATWVESDDSWRMAAWQATPSPDA